MRRTLTTMMGALVLSLLLGSVAVAAEANIPPDHEPRPPTLERRHDRAPTLRDVRRATARFHSVRAVERAGYADDVVPGCFDDPVRGGMGVHYIDASALDDTLDARHPEAIVYEVGRNGRLRLVGVEYVVPPSDVYPADGPAPTLFGRQFTMHPTLGVWKLHAWVWRWNPSGTFSDYNPRVRPCPAD